MASMSVSGIVSGMDWESMIDEIITNAAKPAQPQVNKKTDLTNKKSLFEEMKTMMNSLQSSLSPLKLPSTYKAKTIDIERLDKNSSYKGVLTATANADAEVNIWDVKVNKLATAQINRSKQITGSSLSSTLSGVSGNTMYVNAGGQKIGIEVKSTDTLESLKSRINTTLKTLDSPIYVTASVVDNKLILKSDYTGLGTMTASETTRYNYSSGVNRLSNITIPDAALDSVKVTSGTKSYVIHKDFEVANGNEIRWKQNDRGDSDHLEVGLSGEANINYRMAAGDVYTNKGTYGTDEVEISGFDLVDNGTIASRAKIVDDDGNEYVYGKDFKIVDKKIVWLEAPEVDDSPKYNEPDAYTVSLTKNIPVNITKTYTKGTSTNEPDSYTVSGIGPTPDAVAASGLRGGSTAAGQPYIVSYASGGSVASGSVTTDGTTTTATVNLTVSGGLNYQQLINEISTYEPDATLEIDSGKTKTGSTEHVMMLNYVPGLSLTGLDKNGNQTEFVYGRDYILRDNGSGSGANYGTLAISFRNSDPSGYVNLYRNRGGANVDLSETTYLQPKGSSSFSFSYTPTYSTENGVSEATIIQAAANDGGSVTVTDTSGNPFVEGVDYVVDGGQIKWLDAESDDISFTAEQAAEISALPTITLTDGDNVLRTYVDPEDLSAFTLTDEDGKTYEYGRDYVLRINDTGDGYAVSWLVKSPVDGTAASITNANTVVATYAQYRNISTSSFTSAPLAAKTYSLSFQGDAPEMSEQGSSSLDVTGWTNITVSDGTKTYTEGTDYTVSGGRITWSGTKPSTDDTFSDISLLQSAFLNTTGSSSIPRVTLTDSDGVLRTYLDLDGSEVNFQLADASGNAYTYGRDYVIRVSDDGQNYVISWAVTGDSNNDGTTDVRDFNPVVAAYASEKDINTSNWRTAPTSGKFTFATTSTKTISLSGNVKATDTDKSLAHVLSSSAITSADYGNVTIPGYTQGKDYVINSQGVIRWLNQNSTTPEAYKATYKFSDTASATVSNISASGTSINLYSYGSMPSLANMGVKTFVGDKLNGSTSYNYVDENEGKAAFTLTDSSGNTYEYGKDFAVRCSSLTSTSLQLVMPNNGYWPSSFSNTTRTIPAGETLTLTYNNTATRFVDSEDTLAAGLGFTPSTLSKLTLSDAYGNDYTEDTDYTIDSAGNVTWIDQTTDAPASYKVNYTIGAVNNLTNALEIN
ncbi:MAG: hypothetical protein IJR63_05885, partial [Synergistaceae bacterium]|nr:hypothetical protein [Synergistaceae bacterium]